MTLDLSRFSRTQLAHLPTPFEELERLGRELGHRVFVKRDDCTGLAFGGNKTRKLEFALGQAIADQADVIVTCGGLQSNHVRQTIAGTAKLGLPCHAVLENPLPNASVAYRESGNRMLDDVLGGTVHEVESGGTAAKFAALEAELTAAGHKPYFVPQGASYGIGALGYADCARELLEQLQDRDIQASHIFLTTGSSGTHGGFLAGLRLLGSSIPVIGIAVSETSELKRAKVADIIAQMTTVLGLTESPVTDDDIVVYDDYIGDGYGVETAAANAAIERLARSEGLLLDPVYTGKAMAGMLDLLERNVLGKVKDPVFIHTGGMPGLFAYR